jgi:hypothetical protein
VKKRQSHNNCTIEILPTHNSSSVNQHLCQQVTQSWKQEFQSCVHSTFLLISQVLTFGESNGNTCGPQRKCFISLETTLTCLQCNPLPCNKPCSKSLEADTYHKQTSPHIYKRTLHCSHHTHQTATLPAANGLLHPWQQIEVTRTHAQIVGTMLQSPTTIVLEGLSPDLSCGRWQCQCVCFLHTAGHKQLSKNFLQYSAFTVQPSETLWRWMTPLITQVTAPLVTVGLLI